MGLSQKQRRCSFLLNKLEAWLHTNGYEVVRGEALRTKEQQAIYVETGKSKTMNSFHIICLAQDLSLFKDNVYLTKTIDYKPAGEYWKSLDPECVWGGDWGWDGCHFQFTR